MGLLRLMCLAVSVLTVASLDLKPYDRTALIFFNDFDVNHDDEITEDEIDKLFENADIDSSGDVSRDELSVYIDTHYPSFLNWIDIIEDLFLDFDGDGTLTELDLEEVFETHDQNRDNIITRAEFLEYWTDLLEDFDDFIYFIEPLTDDTTVIG